ncbi:MAG: hypothetical protein U5L08_07645 [Xanthomonadales bacterium]|nr:hypothetical protein [Xanthomonadales bacterium]
MIAAAARRWDQKGKSLFGTGSAAGRGGWRLVPRVALGIVLLVLGLDGLLAASIDTHRVEGIGPSFQEARQDAVRQALQRSVQQLVVTDRLIDNQEIVRDQILSTLNGFVHDVSVISTGRTEFGEFRVEAEVQISGQAIANFVSVVEGSQAEVDGEALFAEARRAREHGEVVGELVTRIMDGFPRDAIEVSPLDVEVEAGGNVAIHFELGPVESFYRSLRQMLDALVPESHFSMRHREMAHSDRDMENTLCIRDRAARENQHWRGGSYDCWQLVPSRVFSWSYLNHDYRTKFVFSVVDEQGDPVLRSGRCIQEQRGISMPAYIQTVSGREGYVKSIRLGIPNWSSKVSLPPGSLDLDRAARVIAMATHRRNSGSHVSALGERGGDVCNDLFEYHGIDR